VAWPTAASMSSTSASWSTAVFPTPIGPVTNKTGTTVEEEFHIANSAPAE
jgi:hypothetical protein